MVDQLGLCRTPGRVGRGRPGHQVVGILNDAVALRILQLLVLVAGHAVEFQQPVLESLIGFDLTGFPSRSGPMTHHSARLGDRSWMLLEYQECQSSLDFA